MPARQLKYFGEKVSQLRQSFLQKAQSLSKDPLEDGLHDTSKLSDKIQDLGTRLKKNLRSFEANEYIEETTLAYRRRGHRPKLSLPEMIDIVRLVKFKFVPQLDVAKQFRVSR